MLSCTSLIADGALMCVPSADKRLISGRCVYPSGQLGPCPPFRVGGLTGSSSGGARTRSPLAETATSGAATVASGSTGMRIQAAGSSGGKYSIGGRKAKSMVLSSPAARRAAVAWSCRGRAAPGPAGDAVAAGGAEAGAGWAMWAR